ncbi:hypothetical protein ASPVEDRAFT_83327 [Aspergillus versicolor CBS 583.65]|uniref:Uncharacterized protein n=1 Tax=Aspergillus versicolor CBS 583.65 TaxID=1036611 RepID=A0A1L9PJZ7_ASPVE|nr:uncharacterized protein ASPVEDRAFT_83327 [Aspergillus versicolor CBS 583.65]OJJ01803.1 hypothetical protein ASPVEDRAFT_83327 [Aspergillus versicolor CBS 583.65]
MPMNWTPEANAKLFLGVLDQLKEKNVKLDNERLAAYMGPECNKKSVENQFTKLRKMVGSDSNNKSAPGTPATPAGTPKKRRAPDSAKSTPSKKKKKDTKDEEEDSSSEEERNVKEVRDEIKNL